MSLLIVGGHLRVLENAGSIERMISGRLQRCALTTLPLKSAGEWIEHYQQFWCETLDALSEYVESGASTDDIVQEKKLT